MSDDSCAAIEPTLEIRLAVVGYNARLTMLFSRECTLKTGFRPLFRPESDFCRTSFVHVRAYPARSPFYNSPARK